MFKKFTALVFFIYIFTICAAQNHDYGFKQTFNIPVSFSGSSNLRYPWTGGLNSCQFASTDLNFDGKKDLVVFDRTGNRLLTFINNGTQSDTAFDYAPEYEKKFPYIHDWIYLVDYNGDGKEDIFTYYSAGMSVYRNDSDPVAGLVFTKMTSVLNSLQYANYLNLYVSEVETPAIADVNGDGCPDILTFHILGSYLNLHTNLSMIKYGNCDSLDFERTEHCWGDFYESENSAELTLNITCTKAEEGKENTDKEILHVGSTILAYDLDGNGMKDLLIGDTDYPNLIAAYNGGTLQHAHITNTDTYFPSSNIAAEVYSMPMPSLLDINNDSLADLVVSPYDANPLLSESKKSNWLYLNKGNTMQPSFELTQEDFLQDNMIEVGTGAYPVLFDIDGDGLKDLFVANYGFRDTSYYSQGFLYSTFVSAIALYKNTGTQFQPSFELVTEDFAGIKSMDLKAAYPTFGDIDTDGDIDMICGEEGGTLYFFENTAGAGNPVVFDTPLANYQSIDVGKYSTPQLIDLNADLLLDIVSGDRRGRLNYFQNTGTPSNPIFTLITDTLGGVFARDFNTSNYGYSVPCFFEDTTGALKLFCASESGAIFYYDSISNNLTGTFKLVEPQLQLLYDGIRSGVAVNDLNSDGYIDMIMGNFSGGLTYYEGEQPGPLSIKEPHKIPAHFNVYPNPANGYLNINPTDIDENILGQVVFYNLTGQAVLTVAYAKQIDINSLSNGMYIMSITNSSGKGVFYTRVAVVKS